MYSALRKTRAHFVTFLNQHCEYLHPNMRQWDAPIPTQGRQRRDQRPFTEAQMSFIFNKTGEVAAQQLHVDQVWTASHFEDLVGNISLLVGAPVSEEDSDRYRLNIIKGSHIAVRLMGLTNDLTELATMKKLFFDAGICWDDFESVVSCPWNSSFGMSSHLLHGGSKKRKHEVPEVTIVAFAYVNSELSLLIDDKVAPKCYPYEKHRVMCSAVPLHRLNL